MSPEQLREVFHVEHKDLVPNYEVVELAHQLNNHHSINKRSINSNNLLSKNNEVSSVSENSDSKSKVLSKNNHHVKKDLSKNRFENKSLTVEDTPSKFSDYDLKSIKQHNVSFTAFGEHLNLTLEPAQGLFRDGPNLLKMWHVRPDANASQGLFYERIKEVSIDKQCANVSCKSFETQVINFTFRAFLWSLSRFKIQKFEALQAGSDRLFVFLFSVNASYPSIIRQ